MFGSLKGSLKTQTYLTRLARSDAQADYYRAYLGDAAPTKKTRLK
jgi:hypothetical protein